MRLPRSVKIVEVGPRDGLQNERVRIPTATKLAFIEALVGAGLSVVEATSFVHPKWVPQLADAEEVLKKLTRKRGVRYPVLVPNENGLERALAAGVQEIAVFTAASESFNKKNINMTTSQSLGEIAKVLKVAKANRLWVRAYISTCFACPYEGLIKPEKVVALTKKLLSLTVDEISLGDTIGVATPKQVERLLGLIAKAMSLKQVAVHFHDTRGTALANILTSLQLGISIVDASAGGLGGCPYAPGAAGNVATEDVVYMLNEMGIETGVSLEKVAAASALIAKALDHPLPGKCYQAVKNRL